MAQGQIRWKRGDFIRLGRAVSDFNKKINELQKEEARIYLPTPLNYTNVKEEITTRRELNRMINSLKRFKQRDASDLYETEAGEQITKWERRELGIQAGIAKRRLRRELKELNEPLPEGYSRAQMGSVRVKEIESQLRNLNKIETKKGYEFKRLTKSIRFQGASDYTMKKATVYRENYIKEMEKYSDFDNYEKFMAKLKSIKNPIDFYNYVSKNELTKDLTYNSDMFYSQAEFNRFIQDIMEEELEDTTDIVKDFMDFKYETYKDEEIEF